MRRTRVSIAAHAFSGPVSPATEVGEIDIVDVDGPAEDLVRMFPGYLTG
jgi:hypothetical protein